MSFITKHRIKDGSETDIEMALIEALENAVVHGNCEDPHKRVYVTCRCTAEGEVSITVQDEGQGFDTGTLPDPTAPENRLRTSGRGIYLMKTLMDEVCFEKGGAVVHMRKKSNAGSAAKVMPNDANVLPPGLSYGMVGQDLSVIGRKQRTNITAWSSSIKRSAVVGNRPSPYGSADVSSSIRRRVAADTRGPQSPNTELRCAHYTRI
jgi:serine/threonine-protein kinase RsbW